ncbi:hypothetical protein [Nonomuraea dietziae]|uniref:hypothetical protein n=1 Tax=Nonomuraea dietziae TaxID=65515 RepID=UPI0031D4A86C
MSRFSGAATPSPTRISFLRRPAPRSSKTPARSSREPSRNSTTPKGTMKTSSKR